MRQLKLDGKRRLVCFQSQKSLSNGGLLCCSTTVSSGCPRKYATAYVRVLFIGANITNYRVDMLTEQVQGCSAPYRSLSSNPQRKYDQGLPIYTGIDGIERECLCSKSLVVPR